LSKADHFILGAWGVYQPEDVNEKVVKDWVELGLNTIMGLRCSREKKEKTLEILDLCSKYGIRMILDDFRGRWGMSYDSENPEEFRKKFTEAYEDFGHHPAVFGFHVGDEPANEKEFTDSAAAHRIQLEVAPELTPYINYLPMVWDIEERIIKIPFSEWAQKMISEANLKVFSYDCYRQMSPDRSGSASYLKNLRMFGTEAEKAGIEPWTIPLMGAHWDYRVPTEDDLRWQLNTAIAHGMKGIIWYHLTYHCIGQSNFRMIPFDEFGERTETFPRVARVNKQFLHQYGDFFKDAKHIATYHTGQAFGGVELYKPGEVTDIVRDVTCNQNLPAVLGFFEKDGIKAIAVVNNSRTETGLFNIHVSKDIKVFERLNWDGEFESINAYYANPFEIKGDEGIGHDWLAPGQLKVYRYE